MYVVVIGQSNAARWFTQGADPGTAADALLRQFDGGLSTIGGNADGAKAYGNAVIAGLTVPEQVVLINAAVGGSALVDVADDGSGYWLNERSGSPYAQMIDVVRTLSGGVHAVVWAQGERDARVAAVSDGDYENALRTLITRLRRDLRNDGPAAALPILLSRVGRGTNAADTDEGWQQIREAEARVAAADANVFAVEAYDVALVDDVHYTNAGAITHGQRLARATLDAFGEVSGYQGPAIASWSRSGTTVTVTLAHGLGSDFTPTTGITGFRFTDDGTEIAINAAVRTNATTVTLTLASSPSGAEALGYAYGANPDISAVLRDNSSFALPLESIEEVSMASQKMNLGWVSDQNLDKHKETLGTGATSDPVLISGAYRRVTVGVADIAGGTAKVQHTTDSIAEVEAGTAQWADWASGDTADNTNEALLSVVTAVRGVANTGATCEWFINAANR